MKKMYVLDDSGKNLFEGTRRECKHFVRKENLRNVRLSEAYVEKVMLVDETQKLDDDTSEDNYLAQAETKEGYFNKVF